HTELMTVTRLARSCHLSRSTVLYYESIGLLKLPARTSGNYRSYSPRALERLRQVCLYRDAGLPRAAIRTPLDTRPTDAGAVLGRRFAEIGASIERLREHQRAIARLLRGTDQLRRMNVVTKEKWTSIMRAAGFSEDDMRRWHKDSSARRPTNTRSSWSFCT